ncbi:hypothetical protein RvY_17541 [Ramazzottius varieornatus]|uniref:Mediator of RNA polymerase II transcription subunit 7 n=1 Tax=Ramazzottius varieornatus TaxID=947166 RepID=A0A1D1W8A4_RAMVA|nr:hypothetical protein RvY_17541 [Ramazzottius varieornatus]
MAYSFPLPPFEYINGHTDENYRKGKAPQPPPVPSKGEAFSVFGAASWNDDHIVRPLESINIRRLYPQSFDRKRELKKAVHSILATFLDLLDVLVKCPRSPKRNEKLEDINLLFIHFQHLLNEYRVHQARDAVRNMLEVQRRQTLELTDRLNSLLHNATAIVASTEAVNLPPSQITSLTWDIAGLKAKYFETLSQSRKTLQPMVLDSALCQWVDQDENLDSDIS